MEKVITTNLASTLSKLIEAKQLKDNKKFTASQLAKAIDVDRSLIQRILNNDAPNPTINTIIKILNFFVKDGFNLRIDDLINFNNNLVDVTIQAISPEKTVKLSLYQMENFDGEPIGEISTQIQNSSPCMMAIVSSANLPPLFKAGSIFIVDIMKEMEHDNLVALKINNCIKIAKFTSDGSHKIFTLFEDKEEKIIKYEKIDRKNILGIIIRINAKT